MIKYEAVSAFIICADAETHDAEYALIDCEAYKLCVANNDWVANRDD